MKNLGLIMFNNKSKLFEEERNNTITTKKKDLHLIKKIRKLLSTNERKEIRIEIVSFLFFSLEYEKLEQYKE